MPKSEIGEVITILKGSRVQYQVRLGHGEIVIVEQAQIQPPHLTLLEKHARLVVTHETGRVISASTSLALTLIGRLAAIQHRPQGGPAYRLEMSQGEPVVVLKSQVANHPARDLIPGAELAVRLEDRRVLEATLLSERDGATVTRIDLPKERASIQGEHSDRFQARLPASVLRQLKVGEKLVMQIQYSPQGDRKITLERPAAPPAYGRGEKEAPHPPDSKVSTPAAPPYERGKNDQANPPVSPLPRPYPPPAPLAEADVLGIDPPALEQLRKAGHRPEILAFLEQHARDGLIEWHRLQPGRPARFEEPARPLSAPLLQAVRAAVPGFRGFYNHQARALDAIRAGRNLVIVTQTASGKTLSYNPAVFESLASAPQGHVLYLFPLNALMMDQKEKIDALVQALGSQGSPLTAELLTGGMGAERGEIARRSPHILATNPEMLSVVLNEARSKWGTFFASLKYIIVDEVHSYRGIFGVHMSGLVRRLLLTARRAGAEPQFILSSATISNPLDLATRLTSLPESSFELLDAAQDGSAQAAKHWALLNPDWGSRSPRFGNYQEVAASAFVELVSGRKPLNTILFCRSIREVKTISRLVEARLRQKDRSLAGKIKTYVSAELTGEAKRDIYEGLRSGRYTGVISTNALEAGIDIGRLDACIIAGFPFSVMAMRQMAGRVGREQEGLVLFVPYPLSSLDSYYRDHPEHLLDQLPEVFVVDPSNPYIARKHINAAAVALGGLAEGDLGRYWGERGLPIAEQALKDGAMQHTGGRWLGSRRNYNDPQDVYAVRNIRSSAQAPYAVCLEGEHTCPQGAQCFELGGKGCPNRVTALDRQYIYRDCHPGAIYEAADRRTYRVMRFDDAARSVRVVELPEGSLERTYVEADLSVEVTGAPRGRKVLQPGIELAWGDATVTRLFTGYYRYELQAARRCRHCRREYEAVQDTCPICHRLTEVYYTHSRPERVDFAAPHQAGFQIVLKTVACWLSVQPELETRLNPASPCKLPGEKNQVLRWLSSPLDLSRLPARLRLEKPEKDLLSTYHSLASQKLAETRPTPQETLLFPALYGQCLLSGLRSHLSEPRALELFQAVSGYPVTDQLNHVCRKCQTSTLFPALHTLEHAVSARYPSVALGDRSDLGAYTTLGHSATGLPTVFWFDAYEGGLGAAEKVYEQFTRLLESGLEALQTCTCTTLEGCPRCSYLPDCSSGNDELNKPAGMALMALALGRSYQPELQAYLYRRKRAGEFDQAYKEQEYVKSAHGMDEEAPIPQGPLDPHQLLRLQAQVHALVADKAFEARSRELDRESPPVSAADLNAAYQKVIHGDLLQEWRLEARRGPYEVLEVLPAASLRMVQQIYRAIALQVHPDANPTRQAWANETMKLLNEAYDKILKEKGEAK